MLYRYEALMKKRENSKPTEITLSSQETLPFGFRIKISEFAKNQECGFKISGSEKESGTQVTHSYKIEQQDHNVYLDLFESLSNDFGLRLPQNRRRNIAKCDSNVRYREVLIENLHTEMLHGYGDPAVIRVEDEKGTLYYLLVTSNDAPQSFPILRSNDLIHWQFVGYVFPKGEKPEWASDGEFVSDYWAAEMHQFGKEFRVYFVARNKTDHELCIGMATSSSPEGPFIAAKNPILKGNVIDPHIFIDDKNIAYLFWKEDNNDIWPGLLIQLLYTHPEFIFELFDTHEDRLTAIFIQTLWPWIKTRKSMERFFIIQVLIESIISRFLSFYNRLENLSNGQDALVRDQIRKVLNCMKTPMFAQRLSSDGLSLIGKRSKIIENDQEWEAHLVEGMWLSENQGNYYLLYAGNDFSTDQYGIGVAISKSPLGPFVKMQKPLLKSTEKWWAPGHPSIATAPDGKPYLFLHAYFPGQTGYKKFRALLSVPLTFEPDRVLVG